MLFNSFLFLLVFLPIALGVHYLLGALQPRLAALWLCVASIVFYGWWNPQFVILLAGSILFNYLVSLVILSLAKRPKLQLLATAFGVAADILLLVHYKYFAAMVNFVHDMGFNVGPMDTLILPLGISFFTFTQIGYLLDCRAGVVNDRSPLSYVLFVTFFPHLIAGPVLHHAQMMPQFANPATYRINPDKVALGLAIFSFGLAKKLLIADKMGEYADMFFNGVAGGTVPSVVSSWFGVLAYTLQIYFDFSGYSDMAVGLSLCFGIWLPLNFNSPYKSTSIIDFWRRWHISLSTFLRDYLYIPLGGNRKGEARRYINLFLTMLLGGLWHGAAWTFVVWGALHGFYLTINHLWNQFVRKGKAPSRWSLPLRWGITFLCVMIAWVVFRADSMTTAMHIYKGMLGLNGTSLTAFGEFAIPYRKPEFFQTMLLAMVIVLALPPTISLQRWVPAVPRLAARPHLSAAATIGIAVFTVVLMGLSISKLGTYSPFLYFQF